jgi:hypothetical protein
VGGKLKRIIIAIAVALALCSPQPAFAHAPTLKVRYTTDLHDKENTGVKGRYWPPNADYFLEECNSAFPTDKLGACQISTPPKHEPIHWRTSGLGDFNWIFTYREEQIGKDGGACPGVDNGCMLVMAPFRANGTINLAKARIVPISFG